MSTTPKASSRRASTGTSPSSSSSPNGQAVSPAARRGGTSTTSPRSSTPSVLVRRASLTSSSSSPRSPGGTTTPTPGSQANLRRGSTGNGGTSPRSPGGGIAGTPRSPGGNITTTPAAVKAALLKVSESVEAAVAALDLEMPTLDLSASRALSAAFAQPPASASPESRRSASPGDRRAAAFLPPPPAIPVRPQSPSSLRPVVATEIAFGRHQSPPRSRPSSPPRPTAALPPRDDGLHHCDNNCGRGAAVWCEKCEIEICPLCDASIHGSNAALRRHLRVHLVDRLPICPRHREACRLFCSDCCALLCQLCVPTDSHKFPDGRGHPIFDCVAAADARRPEIHALATTLREAADSAPAALLHLQTRQQQMHGEISALGATLAAAVEGLAQRLRSELDAFLLADTDQLERFIASTEAARRRLLMDAEVAESVAGPSTPPQSFLAQWRELRGVLQEAAHSRLGQEEPSVRMHVALTGQVQSGKILTLEMEVQRVVDALNKVGAITALPNGRHVVLLPVPMSSPERPERRER